MQIHEHLLGYIAVGWGGGEGRGSLPTPTPHPPRPHPPLQNGVTNEVRHEVKSSTITSLKLSN
jgi:hypothetical protein